MYIIYRQTLFLLAQTEQQYPSRETRAMPLQFAINIADIEAIPRPMDLR